MLRDWGEAPKTAEPNADIELQEELRAEDSSDEDSSAEDIDLEVNE